MLFHHCHGWCQTFWVIASTANLLTATGLVLRMLALTAFVGLVAGQAVAVKEDFSFTLGFSARCSITLFTGNQLGGERTLQG